MSDATATGDRPERDLPERDLSDTVRPESRDETAPDDSAEAAAEYDSLPASEHVAHGEPGADLVDEPAEPDVPAQETEHERALEDRPALVEPPERDHVESADASPIVTSAAADAPRTEPVVSAAPAAVSEAAPVAVAPVAAPAAASSFFVEPPVAPRARHNRGFGVGVALLGSLLFAALYAAVVAGLTGLLVTIDDFTPALVRFLASPAFWVPVIVYVVLTVLVALILNRARWAAHVFFSLLVGLLVYVLSVGIILLGEGVLARDAAGQYALLIQAIAQPVLLAAALCAREVALWTGLGTAARGRRVVARNKSDRDAYDEEKARAEAVWDDPAGTAA